MHYFHRLLLLALMTTLSAGPALADEMFSLKGGYLMLSPKGTFSVSSTTLVGTPINLDNDLGFDDSEDFFVEGALQLGPFRLSASYTPLEFSGAGNLTQDVNFAGQTFSGTAQTASKVQIDLADVSLTWFLINLDDLPIRVQIGPEISLKYVMADLTLAGEVGGVTATEKESAEAPIPTLGARARLSLADFLAVTGRIGFLEFDSNRFLDVDGQIEFSPMPLVGIFGGYRYLDIKVDESNVFIDATFSGPYAGAFLRF
jgi:hypothetical protein